jgi:hypothetical protein
MSRSVPHAGLEINDGAARRLTRADIRRWPFRGSAAVAADLLTWRQLQGPAWRRVLPDTYVSDDIVLTHRMLCAAATVWTEGRGVISGRSAALLLGIDVLARDAPVEVTVPVTTRRRSQCGFTLIRSPLAAGDVIRRSGVPITTPVRTAFDVARRQPFVEAVVGLDALTGALPVDVRSVAAYAQARPRWPGSRDVTAVLDAVEPRSGSPMETRTRLVIVSAGLPRPLAQYEVFDDRGCFVAKTRSCISRIQVGIEYEGDYHRERLTFQADLRRTSRLQELGWTIVRLGPDAVFGDSGPMLRTIRQLLVRNPIG